MEATTSQLIQQLATQLGTTAEFLWGVLVLQAQVAAISAVVLLTAIGLDLLLRSDWFRDDAEEYEQVAIVVVTLLTVALLIQMMLIGGADAITALVNPEYWALQKVLAGLK